MVVQGVIAWKSGDIAPQCHKSTKFRAAPESIRAERINADLSALHAHQT